MNTVIVIVCILIAAAIVLFVVFNVSMALNRRIDEIHKEMAKIRAEEKSRNCKTQKAISKLENEVLFHDDAENEFTSSIDKRDKRIHDLQKQFPMFMDNELCEKANDPCLYIKCNDGSILKYKDNVISVHKMSLHLKTLHASTTGEKRHMQLFDTLELLCNDKNFRSVYAVSDEDNNTLDVVMRDMTVRRYGFNRSYKGDGMVIEFFKKTGIMEDSQSLKR